MESQDRYSSFRQPLGTVRNSIMTMAAPDRLRDPGRAIYGCRNGSKFAHFQTRMDCPWDTIAMVPTPTVAGEVTSLESKQDETALIYDNIDMLEERIRKPLQKGAPARTAS